MYAKTIFLLLSIDFISLFFILNTFQLYYLWLHPPLFNVVFFIYLYAVTSFLQQILIFFWFPHKKKLFSINQKQKKNKLFKKKIH